MANKTATPDIDNIKGTLPSALDLLAPSRASVIHNSKLFAVVYILPVASVLAVMTHRARYIYTTDKGVGLLRDYFGASNNGLWGYGAFFTIMLAVLEIFVLAFATALRLKAAQGEQPTFDDIWDIAAKYWLRLFWLYVHIAVRVVLGLILLIIPGVIAFRKYYLAPYFLVDQDLSTREALQRSAAATKRDTGAIWGVIGLGFLISLLGALPLIGQLISLLFGALYSVAPAMRYQQLK